MKLSPKVQNEIELERKEIANLADDALHERLEYEDKFTDEAILNGKESEIIKFFTMEYRKMLREESSDRNHLCEAA